MQSYTLSRRSFLTLSAAALGALGLSSCISVTKGPRKPKPIAPGAKVRIAQIACGGMGAADVRNFVNEDVVAIADVDWELPKVKEIFAEFPNAKKYKDFRKMLLEMDEQIDAVVISTPDHTHFLAAYLAIHLGKHVYVQKPATQTIAESRALLQLSREAGICSQMGNQGHSNEGTRLAVEWARGGVLGDVKEIHIWTNRPWWPQGMAAWPTADAVPSSLDWDLYLGRSAQKPFSKEIHPFKWRGYRQFGTGSLGDMGCHMFDASFWALDLSAPSRMEVIANEGITEVGYPTKSKIVYHFPANATRGPVKFFWYEGGIKPETPAEIAAEGGSLGPSGQIWIGSKAVLIDENDYCNTPRLIPKAIMRQLRAKPLPKTLPRVTEASHWLNWIAAIRKGEPSHASSNFEYSLKLNEMVLLGALAQAANKSFNWDAAKMSTGENSIDALLTPTYRKGWFPEDLL